MTENTTAQFNVGGTKYIVSRTLFDAHPNSMLTKSASEQWQEDPEKEIFIERDGERFRYVLDYMRDQAVDLPVTETKESLLRELEYYGFEVNKDEVTEKEKKPYAKALRHLRSMSVIPRYAFDVVTWHTAMLAQGKTETRREIIFPRGSEERRNRDVLFNVGEWKHAKQEVNKYLHNFGLEVEFYSNNVEYVKVID